MYVKQEEVVGSDTKPGIWSVPASPPGAPVAEKNTAKKNLELLQVIQIGDSSPDRHCRHLVDGCWMNGWINGWMRRVRRGEVLWEKKKDRKHPKGGDQGEFSHPKQNLILSFFSWGGQTFTRLFQHKKPRLANTGKNYRTCNRLMTLGRQLRKGEWGGGRTVWQTEHHLVASVSGYMGDVNAVHSTRRWRAQVRSSKTIKIRQLSISVSTSRGLNESFLSHLILEYSPPQSPAI